MPADSEVTTALSEQAELAHLRRDQQAAAVVQSRIQACRTQRFGAYQLCCELWPAEALSGDFIDCVELNNHRSAFLVADVAGHGTAAALLTIVLRSFMLRAGQSDQIEGPEVLLQRLNSELVQLDLDRHVCALCGVIDTQSDLLNLASAGAFPLPLLARQGQASRAISVAGKALGLFADATFEPQGLTLKPGDRLTVVTDGALELLGESSLETKEALLAEAAAQPVDRFWQTLGIKPVCGGKDDVSLLTLEHLLESGQ